MDNLDNLTQGNTMNTVTVEENPGNNNNTKEVSGDELELLRKLEEANRSGSDLHEIFNWPT